MLLLTRGRTTCAASIGWSTSSPAPGCRAVTLGQLPEWLPESGAAGKAAAPWSRPAEPEAAPVRAEAAGPRRPPPTRDELEAVLDQNGGSVRAIAKHYGRDRRQIDRWMEAFGLKESRRGLPPGE